MVILQCLYFLHLLPVIMTESVVADNLPSTLPTTLSGHCYALCPYVLYGTPCESVVNTMCSDEICKCRNTSHFIYGSFVDHKIQLNNEAGSHELDPEWPENGVIVTQEICRNECSLRPKCFSFMWNTNTFLCFLTRGFHVYNQTAADENDEGDVEPGWISEIKMWSNLKAEQTLLASQPPYIYQTDFLDLLSIEKLKNYVIENLKNAKSTSAGNSWWDKKVMYEGDVHDPEVKWLMRETALRAGYMIRKYYNVTEPVYPHTVNLGQWGPGMGLGTHADNAWFPSGEPNYTPMRTYAAILYLNSEFTGGKFYFFHPDKPLLITPIPGLLIGFPSGPEYYHGVTEVLSGYRYVCNMWFTNSPRDVDWFRSPVLEEQLLETLPDTQTTSSQTQKKPEKKTKQKMFSFSDLGI